MDRRQEEGQHVLEGEEDKELRGSSGEGGEGNEGGEIEGHVDGLVRWFCLGLLEVDEKLPRMK